MKGRRTIMRADNSKVPRAPKQPIPSRPPRKKMVCTCGDDPRLACSSCSDARMKRLSAESK